MSKFDWFIIGVLLGPFIQALFLAGWGIFKNAFSAWLEDKFK